MYHVVVRDGQFQIRNVTTFGGTELPQAGIFSGSFSVHSHTKVCHGYQWGLELIISVWNLVIK